MDFKKIDLSKVGKETMLLGGVWGNDEEAYFLYLPEYDMVKPSCLHDVLPTIDEWKTFLRQTDIVETEVLEKSKDGKLYKAIVRKCTRSIDQGVSWNVFRRDGYACRYCGNDQVPLTVDHLVLWENGGPSTEANLFAACRQCNKTRGSIEYSDWLNHPFYKKKSKALTEAQRQANRNVAETLDGIELSIRVSKKR